MFGLVVVSATEVGRGPPLLLLQEGGEREGVLASSPVAAAAVLPPPAEVLLVVGVEVSVVVMVEPVGPGVLLLHIVIVMTVMFVSRQAGCGCGEK